MRGGREGERGREWDEERERRREMDRGVAIIMPKIKYGNSVANEEQE